MAQNTGFGTASTDLGLGGSLSQQVSGETDEQRRRRLAQLQQMKTVGLPGASATQMLFGNGLSGTGAGRSY